MPIPQGRRPRGCRQCGGVGDGSLQRDFGPGSGKCDVCHGERLIQPPPGRGCGLSVDFLSEFSRMRSEGSRFTWGSGGEAVFAKFCVCDRNRSQPFATVCVTAVRLSTVASASGVVQKACQIDCLSPQLD